ncbi:MAG: MFS transporter [Dehalococcoidia bacterium]
MAANDSLEGRSGAATAAPVPEQRDEPAEEIGTFHAFRFRDFRILWLGTAFSSGAQWIQNTTMGWLVFDLTGSGKALGLVGFIGALPSPFVAPFSGLASDRINRNVVVAISQAALFINALLLAGAIALDVIQLWHIVLFALMAGILNAFNMPARQSLVFDVVPRNSVSNAVALSTLAFSTMRAVGPAVGGALIVFFGPANNFLLQALLYLSVMVTVLMIKLPGKPAGAARKRDFLGDLVEGYQWVLMDGAARVLLLMMIIYPLLIIPLHNALLPIFARDVFDVSASGLGVMLSALGLGSILGALLTASLNRVERRGLLQIGALFILGSCQAVFSLVAHLTESLWLSVGFLVLAGVGSAIFNTTNQTVLQLLAPDHLRGRITSVLQVQPICMAIGILLTGAAADIWGAAAVGVTISLAAFAVGVLVLVFSPRMRKLNMRELGSRQASRS